MNPVRVSLMQRGRVRMSLAQMDLLSQCQAEAPEGVPGHFPTPWRVISSKLTRKDFSNISPFRNRGRKRN